MKSKSKMTKVFVGSLVPIALVLMLSLQPGRAQAANFTVNSTADTVDAAPGNGVCADASGNCTLRAAIMEANALAGADTIILPASTYTLSILGTGENAAATGDLDITGNLTINGAGAASTIIDGGGIDRVFEVRPGATVEIDGVTVRNGKPGAGGTGGGGISNQGTMTLTNSTVTSNTDGIGGGIYNHGTMTVNSSTVSGNSGAGGVYSGADGLGGGIFNDGTMTVNRSTVSGNTAPGVYWFSPGGGGIFNNIPGSMTVTNSTVSGNTAGTGVVNLSGSLTIESSTVSGNTGNTGYGGGGVLNFSWTAIATTSVFSSTIAENWNLTSRGDAIADVSSPSGSVILKNSIVASPTQGLGSDCFIAAGVLTSLGHNIASDASCGLAGTDDLNSTNPLLGPLANNGGPTETHVLLPGSPAIDAVPFADCTDALGVPIATDQRGVARPQGPACDIGAYEVEVVEVCGDGFVGPGEDCDDGNTAGGDCCSATCTYESSSTVCRASAGACDVAETCTGSSATCPTDGFQVSGTACGNSSNTACDNPDTCDGGGSCQTNNEPDGTMCSDSNACTVNDACSAGSCAGSQVTCFGMNATICGDDGNNVIIGTNGPDVIHGLGGNDVIFGLGGNDKICGGNGNDLLFGDLGNDKLDGGNGFDICIGGFGNDTTTNCEVSIP